MPTMTTRLSQHIRQSINNVSSWRELVNLLIDLDTRTGDYHVPIVSATQADGPPGTVPDVAVDGVLSYFLLDGVAGAKKVYRVFKVPSYYVSGASLHIHWVKSDDTDRSTETVRWLVNHKVFNGSNEDADGGGTTLTLDDTFSDDGTTTRVVHRTANVAIGGVLPSYYIAVSVEKGTPGAGTPMDEPGLVSVDFTFTGYLTRASAPS